MKNSPLLAWFIFLVMIVICGSAIFHSKLKRSKRDAARSRIMLEEYQKSAERRFSDYEASIKLHQARLRDRPYQPPPRFTNTDDCRWWEDRNLNWVATILPYTNHRDPSTSNLVRLYRFLGNQIETVKGCKGEDDCIQKYDSMRTAVDGFMKQMVKDHGGPLIDPNWGQDI